MLLAVLVKNYGCFCPLVTWQISLCTELAELVGVLVESVVDLAGIPSRGSSALAAENKKRMFVMMCWKNLEKVAEAFDAFGGYCLVG